MTAPLEIESLPAEQPCVGRSIPETVSGGDRAQAWRQPVEEEEAAAAAAAAAAECEQRWEAAASVEERVVAREASGVRSDEDMPSMAEPASLSSLGDMFQQHLPERAQGGRGMLAYASEVIWRYVCVSRI